MIKNAISPLWCFYNLPWSDAPVAICLVISRDNLPTVLYFSGEKSKQHWYESSEKQNKTLINELLSRYIQTRAVFKIVTANPKTGHCTFLSFSFFPSPSSSLLGMIGRGNWHSSSPTPSPFSLSLSSISLLSIF